MRVSYSTEPLRWIIIAMNPPTEQLIRDYLNRLSVAARGRLGFSERQSLLDRTRARIEAECGGINGASAVRVRKALADLGDPIVLVELEAGQPGRRAGSATTRYEPSVAGNGHREMAAEQTHASEAVKGSAIGEDLLVSGGPSGPKPERGGGSIRSLLAGLAAPQRRRRSASAASKPVAQDTSGSGAGTIGAPGPEPRKPGLVPAPRRPTASENLASPDLLAASEPRGTSSPPGSRPDRSQGSGGPAKGQKGQLAGSTSEGAGFLGRLISGAMGAARSHTLEVLAIVLLGVGGAVFPPIWLVGVALALPSKKWDLKDKFVGITLPVFLLIIGVVLIIVLGGQQDPISAYAYEAWLGAGRLSRVLAAAGALYLAWSLRRGRRKPKQPPWNVPHRLG
jgi:hypothetical protein